MVLKFSGSEQLHTIQSQNINQSDMSYMKLALNIISFAREPINLYTLSHPWIGVPNPKVWRLVTPNPGSGYISDVGTLELDVLTFELVLVWKCASRAGTSIKNQGRESICVSGSEHQTSLTSI